MIGNDAVIKKNKDMPWRMIEEEAIVVDVDKSEVIYLNEVGALIWKLIAENESVGFGDIIDNICDVFDVQKDEAQEDALEFLNGLFEKEVICY
ncbi:PqqD family protein [Thermodesulfobacteriota bacterium]